MVFANSRPQWLTAVAPANRTSIRVAENGGFTYLGTFDEPEGPMARYIRDVRWLVQRAPDVKQALRERIVADHRV